MPRAGRRIARRSTRGRAGAESPVLSSAQYLADRFHEVPVMVLPCLTARRHRVGRGQAGQYGSVIQAAWSFQLAARARGLGTCWTTLHLQRERDAADVLGIPYARVQQIALITSGRGSSPASSRAGGSRSSASCATSAGADRLRATGTPPAHPLQDRSHPSRTLSP